MELTIKELARSLLLGIQSRPGSERNPSILFIASCLGGIILLQALTLAARSEGPYSSLWTATTGVVFLATPFRGTAFQTIANRAVRALEIYAACSGKQVSDLLSSVGKSTPFLQELVAEFTSVHGHREQSCHLAIFYETKKSDLIPKRLGIASKLKAPEIVGSTLSPLNFLPRAELTPLS